MRFPNRPQRPRRVVPVLVAGIAVLASVLAGSLGASATVPSAASPLGQKQAATGAPIEVGYVYDGVSDNLDASTWALNVHGFMAGGGIYWRESARLAAKLDAIPPYVTGEAAARRVDVQQRYNFTARNFEEIERTIRYACETPVQLDARLGAWARALQEAASR